MLAQFGNCAGHWLSPRGSWSIFWAGKITSWKGQLPLKIKVWALLFKNELVTLHNSLKGACDEMGSVSPHS